MTSAPKRQCERCGDFGRIITTTDDGLERLCVFCMFKRSKETRDARKLRRVGTG